MLAAAMMVMMQAAAAPAPAHAHEAAAACSAVTTALPPEFAGWAQADSPPATPLPLARPVSLPLSDSPVFPYPPARPAQPGTRGATMALRIETAGRYLVAVDSAAWIDLISTGGEAARPAQFGHGPQCSGIRKLLRFDLAPGDYVLQFSNVAAPTLRLMVSRVP